MLLEIELIKKKKKKKKNNNNNNDNRIGLLYTTLHNCVLSTLWQCLPQLLTINNDNNNNDDDDDDDDDDEDFNNTESTKWFFACTLGAI